MVKSESLAGPRHSESKILLELAHGELESLVDGSIGVRHRDGRHIVVRRSAHRRLLLTRISDGCEDQCVLRRPRRRDVDSDLPVGARIGFTFVVVGRFGRGMGGAIEDHILVDLPPSSSAPSKCARRRSYDGRCASLGACVGDRAWRWSQIAQACIGIYRTYAYRRSPIIDLANRR